MVPVYPTRTELNVAIYQLNLHAIYEGVEHQPRVRLSYLEGALWLDLGRSDWKCVRIKSSRSVRSQDNSWEGGNRVANPDAGRRHSRFAELCLIQGVDWWIAGSTR
jgi:hypothetical protein